MIFFISRYGFARSTPRVLPGAMRSNHADSAAGSGARHGTLEATPIAPQSTTSKFSREEGLSHGAQGAGKDAFHSVPDLSLSRFRKWGRCGKRPYRRRY